MPFVAIEVCQGESPHDAIGVFMRTAANRGIRFKRLNLLRVFPHGPRDYAHVRTDCSGLIRLVQELRKERSLIIPESGGYRAYLPEGEGSVPRAIMQAVGPVQRTYRGPAVEHWERQFASMPGPGVGT
jgi:hypothetical protein